MNTRHSPGRRRGFSLLTVLIAVVVLSIICGSMLVGVSSESTLTRRTSANEQLRYTSDAVLDYAYAQVMKNPVAATSAGYKPALPPDSLFPADDPSGGKSSVTALAHSYAVSNANYEVIMAPLAMQSSGSTGAIFTYDTHSPINANLALAGSGVTPNYLRSIGVIAAKSAVANPQASASEIADASDADAHIYQYSALVIENYTLGIFNYLGFFDVGNFRINNPGSDITLNGPIQANKGISLVASSTNSDVRFLSKVSTPGTFVFSGSASASQYKIADGTSVDSSGIPIANVDMLAPGKSYLRTTADDYGAGTDKILGTADDVFLGTSFRDFMLNTTKGNLSTAETGAGSVTLQGAGYKEDTDAGVPPSMSFAQNRIIDPPNPNMLTGTADQQAAENAKISRQASLYVYVEQNGSVTVFVNRDATTYKDGVTNSDAFKNVLTYKSLTSDAARATWKANNAGLILDPAVTGSFITLPSTTRYYSSATPTASTDYTDVSQGAIFDGQQKQTVSMVDIDLGKLNEKINPTNADPGAASGASLKKANGDDWAVAAKTGWNGVLYVDVQNPTARLTAPVTTGTATKDSKGKVLAGVGSPVLSTGVPAPSVPAGSTQLMATQPSLILANTTAPVAWDGTKITAASDEGLTAVRIKNANNVPGAQSAQSDRSSGFTLATNTATYTVGSFNADGKDEGSGATSLQDAQPTTADAMLAYKPDGATKQLAIPAAIMSDKNIALSANFSDLSGLRVNLSKSGTYPPGFSSSNWPFDTSSSRPLKGSGNGYYQYQQSPGDSSTAVMELNAGFIIGDDTVGAVNAGTYTNQGMHTIISFLQPFNSSKDSLIMRGAISGIYRSRYFNAKAGSFNDYYVAPKRRYGFSTLFKAGIMPPATPTVAHFRKIRKFIITAEQYARLKATGRTVGDWIPVLQECDTAGHP